MSLPKKGSRKINVDNIGYLWMAKGNGERINLTIAPIKNGRKIFASFNYNTEFIESNAFNYPFIITPYIVRTVILFAIKNGYLLDGKSTEMNLGNLTKKINLDLSGERKSRKLVNDIERRISSNHFENKAIKYILEETKSLIKHGEWFVGFEMMVSNFHEVNFKIEASELALMKEIFKKANVDWRKDWSWVEEMKK